MPPSGEPVDKTVGKRSTRNMGQRKLPAGEVSNDVPKTPSRPTKRGRVSDSLKDAPPASPASSLTKKLKTLKLGDNDDEESELSELDETSTISDDGADSSKAPPLEDPFVEKASVPASSAKNVEPEKETVYLEDLRGVIRCSSLPSSNGISPHVRDEDLYKLFPRMPEPPLVLGHFITWMNRDDDYAAMRPVILNYMAYYYKQFPDSSVLLRCCSALVYWYIC
ncbi:hypothetical protein MD484_g8055, partial [Candolleomyces efflorescens]